MTTDLVNTDPIHSTEHITSLNIPAFTDRLTDYYLYNFLEGTAYDAIKLSEDNLVNIYQESGSGENADYRQEKLFFRNSNGYYTPLKLAQDRSSGIFEAKPDAIDPSPGNAPDRGRELFEEQILI